MPKWAEGLGESVVNENGAWIANSPMGKVKIKFADKNKFGVVDHDVTIESGKTFANPMRVIPNLDGCDVVFTLFRQPEMTNTQFAEDEDMITKDLAKLKSLLELATSTH